MTRAHQSFGVGSDMKDTESTGELDEDEASMALYSPCAMYLASSCGKLTQVSAEGLIGPNTPDVDDPDALRGSLRRRIAVRKLFAQLLVQFRLPGAGFPIVQCFRVQRHYVAQHGIVC